MKKETLYERIEAYLAGTTVEEERELFDQQMAADPELAAAVELHRRIEAFVADKEKLAFRQKAAEAAEAFPSPPRSSRSWLRGMGLLIVLLAALGSWWYLGRNKEPVDLQQTVPSLPAQEMMTDTIPAAPLPDTSTAPLPSPTPSVAPSRNPFAPLRALEKELQKERDAYLSVEVALLEAFPGTTAGTRDVRFNGRLLTALEPPRLELHILDNTSPEGRVLLRIPVSVSLIDDGENYRAFAAKRAYNLEAGQTAALSKGLYYGRLTVVPDGRGIWMGKAKVE